MIEYLYEKYYEFQVANRCQPNTLYLSKEDTVKLHQESVNNAYKHWLKRKMQYERLGQSVPDFVPPEPIEGIFFSQIIEAETTHFGVV